MIDTLFFVIQISGLIVIVFWAHRNDLCAAIAAQQGILAMMAPEESESEEASTDEIDVPPTDRSAPPRRRFITS